MLFLHAKDTEKYEAQTMRCFGFIISSALVSLLDIQKNREMIYISCTKILTLVGSYSNVYPYQIIGGVLELHDYVVT